MTANTNPLTYNLYVQQIGILAVALTSENAGVWQFNDAPLQGIVQQMLNYAEQRIARDLDILPSQTSNTYALTAGQPVFALPIDDFFTVQTLEIAQINGAQVVNATPLLPVSKEFIQNVYSGLYSAGTPKYYAMYGDTFAATPTPGAYNTNTNILLGPAPNYGYTLRVTGTVVPPSLYKYAVSGVADTASTYISTYYPDMLLMASMIYVSAFQRNFSATSDSADMGLSYEKAYQALRLGAIPKENQKKQEGSSWSGYSTPTSATQTR